jgi:hypothetical protein
MFSFDHMFRVTTATVGALVLSTATVIAAAGPADAGNHAGTVVASVETAAQANG